MTKSPACVLLLPLLFMLVYCYVIVHLVIVIVIPVIVIVIATAVFIVIVGYYLLMLINNLDIEGGKHLTEGQHRDFEARITANILG